MINLNSMTQKEKKKKKEQMHTIIFTNKKNLVISLRTLGNQERTKEDGTKFSGRRNEKI